jgi:hypothetical protein
MMRNDDYQLARRRNRELGGSKITLTIVLLVLFLGGYAGINFIPVAYGDSDIKQQMQTIATNATILPSATTGNNQIPWATTELNRLAAQYEIPPTAFKAEIAGPAVKTSVKYRRKIPILPFGLYVYEYDLEYSASTAGFGGPSK